MVTSNTIALKQTGTRENEHPLGTKPSRAELPTVQPSDRTAGRERDIEEIMQEVERLLGLNRVTSQEKQALTAHQRDYFAHRHAAKFQLSQVNMDGFKRELKCAGYELADLEEILAKHSAGSEKRRRGHSIA